MAMSTGWSTLRHPTSAHHTLPPFTSSLPSSNITAFHHHHHHSLQASYCISPSPISLFLPRRSRRSGRPREGPGRLGVICGEVSVIEQNRFGEEVLDSDKPVLVDFVADWCGPCRLVAPIVASVSEDYKDQLKVVKIDHDASPELIKRYKVYGLPTLIVFKDGKEVPNSRIEGAVTRLKLKQFLDSFLAERAAS